MLIDNVYYIPFTVYYILHTIYPTTTQVVTTVFKQYETGLREGRISVEVRAGGAGGQDGYLAPCWGCHVGHGQVTSLGHLVAQDLHTAMMACGLNPKEQEIIDMANEVARSAVRDIPL